MIEAVKFWNEPNNKSHWDLELDPEWTLGVRHLRTGLSWADSFRPGADAWFDRQLRATEDFEVTLTLCFTPEHRGLQPHHTSPPQAAGEYAESCARMVQRYAGASRPRAEDSPALADEAARSA